MSSVPALSISSASTQVVVSKSIKLNIQNALGLARYRVSSGGGQINTEGVYTAPSAPGTAVVEVKDGSERRSTLMITILPALSSSSNISALINSTTPLNITGGIHPYTLQIISGIGSINTANAYVAPATPGTTAIRVTDKDNNSIIINITILASLSITPTATTILTSSQKSFITSGGNPPYIYSITTGGGTISNTGVFTAPPTLTTSTIKVLDSAGVAAFATVTVVAPVTISPNSKTMVVNQSFQFSASGGLAPYVFTASSGTINSSTGLYTAPASGGATTVTVRDALLSTSTSSITISSALSVTPMTKSLAVNNQSLFSVAGGVPPYVYSVRSGSGTFIASPSDPTKGLYSASSTAGTTVLSVKDSTNTEVTPTVTIVSPLNISPASTSISPGGSLILTASGGVTPYTFSITSGSGATITSAGLLSTTSSATGAITANVTDSMGNFATSTIVIETIVSSSGGLDTSFGNGGIRIHSIGGDAKIFNGALQADGKIVAVGSYNTTSGLIIRFNADGSLDTSFDHDGVLTLPPNTLSAINAVVIQPDQKIVLGGTDTSSAISAFGVMRLNSDGSSDTTFGSNGTGRIKTTLNDSSSISALVLQPSGQIIAAGWVRIVSGGGSSQVPIGTIVTTNYAFAAAKYDANGTPITSFSNTAKHYYISSSIPYEYGIGGAHYDRATAAALDNNGKLIIAGVADGWIGIVRCDANTGIPDNTFGASGIINNASFGHSVNGAYTTNYYDQANTLKITSDNKIIIAGGAKLSSSGNYAFGITKLNSNGNYDLSFSASGRKLNDLVAGDDLANSVVLHPSQKITLVGSALSKRGLTRYLSSGSDDTTFNFTGQLTTTFTNNAGTAAIGVGLPVAFLTNDGKIITVGSVMFNGTSYDIGLARYLP